MSILFVLLTFLLILTVMYFRRPQDASDALAGGAFQGARNASHGEASGLRSSRGYCFHPGHTWVLDEGHQNARVGIDAFAGNLFGKIDSIEIADLNRWVRQGQKLCTVKREGQQR